MRHRVRGRRLNRTMSHRVALRRNLVQSLFEHGEVRTTVVKAKEVRSMAEKLVTLAIKGTLADRQRAEALLQDRAIIPKENREEYDGLSDAKRDKALRSRVKLLGTLLGDVLREQEGGEVLGVFPG